MILISKKMNEMNKTLETLKVISVRFGLGAHTGF